MIKRGHNFTVFMALAFVVVLVSTSCGRFSRRGTQAESPKPTSRAVGAGIEVEEDPSKTTEENVEGNPASGGTNSSGGSFSGGHFKPRPGFSPPGGALGKGNDNYIDDFSSVGTACRGLIRAQPYNEIVLEIDYMPGKAPSAAAVEYVIDEISKSIPGKKISAKGGNQMAADRKTEYSGQDTVNFARGQDRQYPSKAPVGSIWIGYLDGGPTGGSPAIGWAVAGTVIGMFPDRFNTVPGGLSPLSIEKSVLLHEVGHILGLVHICYTHSHTTQEGPHSDPSNPSHNASRGSVMYYAAESTSIGEVLGSEPLTFDTRDRADLKKIYQGKLGGSP